MGVIDWIKEKATNLATSVAMEDMEHPTAFNVGASMFGLAGVGGLIGMRHERDKIIKEAVNDAIDDPKVKQTVTDIKDTLGKLIPGGDNVDTHPTVAPPSANAKEAQPQKGGK